MANADLQAVASALGADHGHWHPVDERLSTTIAAWWDWASDPDNTPRATATVRAAYDALAEELNAQALVLYEAGFTLVPSAEDPFAGSADLHAHLATSKAVPVLASYLTHSIWSDDQNLIFRFVHDLIGHGAEGYSFGPKGEWNAMLHHAQTFSPLARLALYSETAGQNAWFNFGPVAQVPGSPVYAEQLGVVLPEALIWALEDAVAAA